MSQNEIDYRLIRRRAEERLQRDKLRMRRIFFGVYLFMFVVFMIVSWGLYLSAGGSIPVNIPGVATTNDPIAGAMVMLSMLGFMGVLFQMISMIVDTKAGERQMRERAYGQVLSEEMMRLGEEDDGLREKPKHMTRLTDDGELEEVPIDEEAYLELDNKAQWKSS